MESFLAAQRQAEARPGAPAGGSGGNSTPAAPDRLSISQSMLLVYANQTGHGGRTNWTAAEMMAAIPPAQAQQIVRDMQQAGVRMFSSGGISTGPSSGYPALLHGIEAVVPLPDGRSIPVDMRGSNEAVVAAVRELIAEVRRVGEAVVGHTSDTARSVGRLERWERMRMEEAV